MTDALPLTRLEHGASGLADEVYAVLGAAIRDGTLAPGRRLRDVEVAAALGVSRTPVREALQRLVRIGLVDVAANRYTRVAAHDEQLIREAHEYLVYAVGIGLRMSLARSTDEELADQLEWIDHMVEASEREDSRALIEASTELYRRVCRTSGNGVFLKVMREAAPFFQRSVGLADPYLSDREARTSSLRALRDAVARRDGDTAERIVREQYGVA